MRLVEEKLEGRDASLRQRGECLVYRAPAPVPSLITHELAPGLFGAADGGGMGAVSRVLLFLAACLGCARPALAQGLQVGTC